jgi:hypothetical protein
MSVTSTSTVTTFAIFQQLLRNAVNNDSSLDATTKASMLARIDDLPQMGVLVEDYATAESYTGDVTVDPANRSIEIGTTATGINRVIFALHTFPVPVTIAGADTLTGFYTGGTGVSPNPEVAIADLGVQYRFSTTDSWKNLSQSSLLKGVTAIQLAVDIADQVALAALPQIVLAITQE